MEIVLNETKKLIFPSFFITFFISIAMFITGYGQDILSLVFGTIYSIINFWCIGCAISVALSKPLAKVQMYMTFQYILRYVITGFIIYYSIIIPSVNAIFVVIPMFFPKIILITKSLLLKKGV